MGHLDGIRDVDLLTVVADIIGETAAEFDVEAIARAAYRFDRDRGVFVPSTSPDEFWQIVERHQR